MATPPWSPVPCFSSRLCRTAAFPLDSVCVCVCVCVWVWVWVWVCGCVAALCGAVWGTGALPAPAAARRQSERSHAPRRCYPAASSRAGWSAGSLGPSGGPPRRRMGRGFGRADGGPQGGGRRAPGAASGAARPIPGAGAPPRQAGTPCRAAAASLGVIAARAGGTPELILLRPDACQPRQVERTQEERAGRNPASASPAHPAARHASNQNEDPVRGMRARWCCPGEETCYFFFFFFMGRLEERFTGLPVFSTPSYCAQGRGRGKQRPCEPGGPRAGPSPQQQPPQQQRA